MKNNKTIYHFVVDQSGSMSGSEGATIEGFNSQLKTLKSLKKKENLLSNTILMKKITRKKIGNTEKKMIIDLSRQILVGE